LTYALFMAGHITESLSLSYLLRSVQFNRFFLCNLMLSWLISERHAMSFGLE